MTKAIYQEQNKLEWVRKRTEQMEKVLAWQTKCSMLYYTLSVLCGAFGKSCTVIHLNTLFP